VSWWPWHGSDDASPSPEPEPEPEDTVELTSQALQVLWQTRVALVDALVTDALQHRTDGLVPADVLLDILLALRPIELRREVPVIPGPDGARRA